MSKPATDLTSAVCTLDSSNATHLTIAGQSALSPFRLKRLQQLLRQSKPSISSVTARFRYFADLRGAMSRDER
ncbi:MAG: hypothetical protein OEW68_15700, partial [Gammaproteobacteria bacterium]|nr:hypothetical protein [Gammaproteobacteria bacterium]